MSAAAIRLTSTGGRVDDFWWSPDGQRIAYKVSDATPNIRGDIRVMALSSRAVVWDLGSSVDFFSFSPDGAGWAAGSINLENGVLTGVDVKVGQFPQTSSQAETFTMADSDGSYGSPPTPVQFNWGDYQDRPPLLVSVLRPDAGIFWQRSGIYEHLDGLAHLYTPTGTWQQDLNMTVPLLDQLQGFPANSAFTKDFQDVIARICAGAVGYTAQPDLMGLAFQMTVSGDGRTSLISVHDGGWTIDIERLYADGRHQYLTDDGTTMLPRWQY